MVSLRLLLLSGLILFTSPLLGAPANDNIADAIAIIGETGVQEGTVEGATAEPGEFTLDYVEPESVWFSYTPTATGDIRFAIADADARLYMEAFVVPGIGTPKIESLGPMSALGFNEVVVPVTAGERILLKVSRLWYSTSLEFEMQWEFESGGIILLQMGSPTDIQEVEGKVEYMIMRTRPADHIATVHYSITYDTASPADITFPTTGTVVFGPGEQFKYITFHVHADGIVEGPERFTVHLDSAEGALITLENSVILTIADRDDDPANDLLSDAIALSGTFGTVHGTLEGADREIFQNDVFYTWTAQTSGTVQVALKGKATGFHIFEGPVVDHVDVWVETSRTVPPGEIIGHFSAVAGRTYTLLVADHQDGRTGAFSFTYDMDSDGDSLLDSIEAALGTNPRDIDSDDDGLTDDAELDPGIDTDGDGLVNAMDRDSDNDGLADGIEMGIAVPSSGTNTQAVFFIPDADGGATKTNMLLADSDGSGAFDGYEDANHNGTVDPRESDPNNPADDPAGLIRFRPVPYSAEEGYTIRFLIERSGNPRGSASVTFSTPSPSGPGEADWQDFIPQSENVTFADGELGTKTLDVPLLDDTRYEDSERFRVVLIDPVNAVLATESETWASISDNDPFVASSGKYSGTFGSLQGPTGAFTLKLTPQGSFTGTLMHGQARYRFRGSFAASGLTTVEIPRKGRTSLFIDLRVIRSGALLTGTVREGANTKGYELTGGRLSFNASNPPLPPDVKSQKLSFILAPGEEGPIQYRGTGYATGTLTSKGILRMAGRLPDGTSFSTSGAMDADRAISVQQPLYRGIGGLFGKLAVDTEGTAVEGELGWIRTPTAKTPGGYFSAEIHVQGFAYLKPDRGERILPQLEERDGRIALLFTWNDGYPLEIISTLGSNHRLTDSNVPSRALKGTANQTTGLVRGSFQPPGAAPVSFSGVFIQKTGTFAGQYRWLGSTRRITSEPVPSEQ